jgi:hypothetical protein
VGRTHAKRCVPGTYGGSSALAGARLAKALKAAMPRQVHESHAQAEFMRVGNSGNNAAMRSINERAGFKPHSRFVEYQVTRDALDLWSSGHTRRELIIMCKLVEKEFLRFAKA